MLGIAQAAALAPGVSRNGVTLAAARWRRVSRAPAHRRSRPHARPLNLGGPELRRTLAVGFGASFLSTLASQRLIGLVERDRALWPYAAYRAALAGVVLVKSHRGG